MKRKLAIVLAAAMAAMSMTGCLNNASTTTTSQTTVATAEISSEAETNETKKTSEGEDYTYQFDASNVEKHTFSLSTTAPS